MKKHLYVFLAILPLSIVLNTACIGKNRTSDPVSSQGMMNEANINLTNVAQVPRPKMQVVFLLDATGSMSGLIGAAKEKIWSIAGSLTQTNPSPDLEIGLIFYRDRGDAFVTKHIPLGKDLDNMYEKLMDMRADGGGDTPESVNQALHESITRMQWDNDPKTYRAIFLVGDCPPHMDYQNDVKYPQSCDEANRKNIVINTILMGNDSDAMRIWKIIAQKTNGEFIQTDMQVNNITITTPYDKQINDLQYKLDQTRVYYGKSVSKTREKLVQSDKMKELAGDAVSARRSDFITSESGKASYYGSEELVNDVMNDKKLSEIKESELPENMKKMSATERKQYVDKLADERKKLEKELAALNKKRQEHINKELEKMDESEVNKSFDDVIFNSMQEQAASKDIILEGKAKR